MSEESAQTTESKGSDNLDLWNEIRSSLPPSMQKEVSDNESVSRMAKYTSDPLPWETHAVEDSADESDDAEPQESELEIDGHHQGDDDVDEHDDHDDESSEESEELETDADVEREAATTTIIHGDEELSIPLDAVLTVPVDGEEMQVTMQEVMNGISGQKAIAQRFSLLDKEKKALEARSKVWNEGESKVRQLIESGNVVDALDFIFERGGFSSEEVMLTFFNQISEPLQTYLQMPPEQREAWAIKVQAERNRLQYENERSQREQLQAKQDQLNEVRRVQSQYGLDDAAFAELYYQLESDMDAGIIEKQAITADLVGRYGKVLERENWVMSALNEIDPKLAKDSKVVSHVYVDLRALGPEATEQDVKDLIQKAYGQPAKLAKAQVVNKVLDKKGSPKMTDKSNRPAAPNKSRKAQADQARPKHFLEQIVEDYDLAATAKDRQKVRQKWKENKK